MRISSRLLGRVAWQPAGWVRSSREHWRRIAAAVLFAGVLATCLHVTMRWWERRPKPDAVRVTIEPIAVTPTVKGDDKLTPQPLTVRFSQSAAPLDRIGKGPGPGVQLDPPADGQWLWTDDARLVFIPAKDWPAETKYRVRIAKAAVSPSVLLEQDELEVTTPPFRAEIKEFSFYQDPTDPSVRQAVATIEFTHPADRDALTLAASLSMIGGTDVFPDRKPPFTVEQDRHRRVAYLRSLPLALPEREDFMKLTLAAGFPAASGVGKTRELVERKVRIPDRFSFFKITSVEGTVVVNQEGECEQFVVVETTAAAAPEEIAKALRVSLLPPHRPAVGDEKAVENYPWKGAEEITPEIVALATPVPVKLVPGAHPTSQTASFRIAVPNAGHLCVQIAKGARAVGDFALGADYKAVVPVPMPENEIAFEGEGGVLARRGERKLSVRSRGVREIEYVIARVPADQINHLVSQTRGEFQSPEFVNWHFNEQNIARIATERQSVRTANPFSPAFSSFDFSRHLAPANDGGSPLQGLFLLRAHEWKEPKVKPEDEGNDEQAESDEREDDGARPEDRRFILVTDLGLLAKHNADGSRDLFVCSLREGKPAPGVAVEILAKNGVPLIRATTDESGRASFPPLTEAVREKTPIAFVARLADDVSFMPFDRHDRELDFSRFDIGGIESPSGTELDAFVFTERGIYRPGDEVHAGVIIKRRDWSGAIEGIPLELEVSDPSGQSVQVQKVTVPATGFLELTCPTQYQSPSGDWTVSAHVLRHGHRHGLLGSAQFRVKEFLPDRMKMETRLSVPIGPGWIEPRDVQALVSLQNLYGSPAAGRRITARLTLCPRAFGFAAFPEYRFFDPLREGRPNPNVEKVDLGEVKTDDKGAATVDLALERFAEMTSQLALFTEGFEPDSGRSVTRQVTALVSSLPYVIGCKPDGDLRYVTLGSARRVEFIALDKTLAKVGVDGLRLDLIEETFLSVLTRQENGNFAYESVRKEKPVASEPVQFSADGLHYQLPTASPGNFILELRDAEGRRVSRLNYTVVGLGAVSRSLEKNAELEIKLSKGSYNIGEQIEIAITAPYAGAGLITIEREKVYAHRWFQAAGNSSVQQITVPADLEGTGYVNVSFVRSLDSKEVFMSPLSYGVVPFQANIEKRRLPITLRVPARVKPGEPLPIRFKTDRASKIAVFAVDQGILQVTDYRTPEPLAHFFRKASLLVQTSQIVDLILPEFSVLRSAAAFGGDGDLEKNLNPFRRITEKPVVFWSGLIDAGPVEREVIYQVPDYFNGTLTVMAVAVAADGVGSAETSSLVRGPFVITPNVPTLAAPGDVFEVSVTLEPDLATGDSAATLTTTPSEHLEIVKAPVMPMPIAAGRDATATFTVRAREALGSASLLFAASANGETSRLRSTLSVRPAVPFTTRVRGGNFTGQTHDEPVQRNLRPEFRKLEAVVSALPLGLARGLDAYLKSYPNGCSEQITSAAFCRLMLGDETDFGLSREEVRAQIEHTFRVLGQRQNDQGAFGYWSAGEPSGADVTSVYVTSFLIEAKRAGFTPPESLLQNALRHLTSMAAADPHSLAEARTIAHAIYVLTREGSATTNYILNLRDYLDRAHPKRWRSDLVAVHLAGALELLKLSSEADKLIASYRLGGGVPDESGDFHSQLSANSQYVAIAARHFPAVLRRITAKDFEAVVTPVCEGHYNTHSAACAVVALKAYSKALAAGPVELTISENSRDKRIAPLGVSGRLLQRAAFSPSAASVRFSAKNGSGKIGTFFQVIEAGFDRDLPDRVLTNGLEVQREFLGADGEPLSKAVLGEPITVRLRVRSLLKREITNVAIVDLLPGGFELARESLRPGAGTVAGMDYVEVREDRTVFFGTVRPRAMEIRYQIKPCNRGEFVVPPVFAESMYDRAVHGCGTASRIVVEERK